MESNALLQKMDELELRWLNMPSQTRWLVSSIFAALLVGMVGGLLGT